MVVGLEIVGPVMTGPTRDEDRFLVRGAALGELWSRQPSRVGLPDDEEQGRQAGTAAAVPTQEPALMLSNRGDGSKPADAARGRLAPHQLGLWSHRPTVVTSSPPAAAVQRQGP